MRYSFVFVLPLVLVAGLFATTRVALAQTDGDGTTTPLAPITKLDSPQPLNYTMALLRDRGGNLWVGTEGEGVWRYDPSKQGAGAWTQFKTKNGLGDDFCYALAQDLQGRIWVGHATAGVSVWNGRAWANYGPVADEARFPPVRSGPLGERIFSIAVVPFNGDVVMGTSEGLAIYLPKTDSWKYRTRRDGLPSNQIQAVAVDSYGNIYAGTQCDGIAKGTVDSDFKRWTVTRGPAQMPNASEGKGLPSSQINDLVVTDDDTIYAATKCGLARSSDLGDSWTFLRGIGWDERVKGRTQPQTPQPRVGNQKSLLLREDYVTGLAEDPNGLLVLGYRQRGFEVRRPSVDRPAYLSAADDTADFPYVSSVWPQPEGPPILGFYGGGLKIGDATPPFVATKEELAAFKARRGWKKDLPPLPAGPVALPSGAKAPTPDEIDELLKPLSGLSKPFVPGAVAVESDDWRTKGDWVGRYGREYAVLCAARAPLNHYVLLNPQYSSEGTLGPHIKGDDSLRHWVHWVKTDNPNSLYDPVAGYRRQSEWDDHGETYPMTWEGPDVWAKVAVPEGVHRLSLYFFNKDGLFGSNRARDYLIEIKSGENLADAKAADAAPTLASARVRDFWNGVYKRFIVRGPATYGVKVGRDGSFNTILSAVMMDKLFGPQTWADTMPLAYMGRFKYQAPDWTSMTSSDSATQGMVQQAHIWEWKLGAAATREGGIARTDGVNILALRALMAQPQTAPPQLLARWRWKNALWNKRDHEEWFKAMNEGREAFFVVNPKARNVDF